MTEPKKKKGSSKAPFTLEYARAEVLAKVAKGGAKGAGSPITVKTAEPKRSLYEQALRDLEAERAIFVDRSKANPKYFSPEYAPSAPTAAAKMEQWMARQPSALVTLPELKKYVIARRGQKHAQTGKPIGRAVNIELRLLHLHRIGGWRRGHGGLGDERRAVPVVLREGAGRAARP